MLADQFSAWKQNIDRNKTVQCRLLCIAVTQNVFDHPADLEKARQCFG